MQIKTSEGIAEAQPLSDIQQYNRQLRINNYITASLAVLGWSFFALILWIVMYVIQHYVLNNIVRSCL